MLVSLIAVVQVVLENFVQGACLAFVRDVLFIIPLNLLELFIKAVALPGFGKWHRDKTDGLVCFF